MARIRWLRLASLQLDSGPQRFSETDVRVSTSYQYTGSVLAWGTIDRTVPVVSGLPQTADARIRVADTHRYWRNFCIAEPFRRRLLDIRIGPETVPESEFQLVFTGEIVDAEFGPGFVEFTLRDRTFAWLDEPIKSVLTREVYPDMPKENEGGFLNIICGQMRSIGSNNSPITNTPAGLIPCPHFGLIGDPVTADRYGLARHPVYDVWSLYRKTTNLTSDDGEHDNEWEPIDPSEYTVTIVEVEIDGLGEGHTFIDFYLDQGGAEVRADVDGIDRRGAWGTLPEVGPNAPALRNPIDFFINLTYLVIHKAGLSINVFDLEEIAALREKFEGPVGSGTILYCDGAITKAMTAREFLGQWLPSFNLRMYQNRKGLITLSWVDVENLERPVFTEANHILRGTFKEQLPETIANQVQFRYDYNPIGNRFESWGIINTDEQEELSIEEGTPPEVVDKIETEVFDMYFVRDTDTAKEVVRQRLECLSLKSFRQEFQLPLPPVIADIDLCKQIGITHSQGLAVGGYDNTEVLVTGLTVDLDKYTYIVHSVLRVPQPFTSPPSGLLWLGICPTSSGAVVGSPLGFALSEFVAAGVGPYLWELVGGTLPPGITLDADNGDLTGTPTTVGSWDWVIKVTDLYDNTMATLTCTTAIADGNFPDLSWSGQCPTSSGATVDAPLGFALSEFIAGGIAPYSWVLIDGEVPPGTTLDPDIGDLIGTPTEAGTFCWSIEVTDSHSPPQSVVMECCTTVEPAE